MRRVVILGNGLSISASNAFRTADLTTQVRAKLSLVAVPSGVNLRDLLDDAGQHMFPQGYDPITTFEHLLGPLDRMALLLGEDLLVLSEMVEQQAVFEEAAVRIRELYFRGVAAVLEVVNGASQGANLSPVRQVVDWVLCPGAEETSIYTLNYDPLIDRALMAAREERDAARAAGSQLPEIRFDDEFSGFAPSRSITVNAVNVDVLSARGPADGRIHPVHLYHQHGGLHWLVDETGLCKPRDIDALRHVGVWNRWIAGQDTHVRPSVILTDQKATAVTRPPYDGSYRSLEEDLLLADRVLIGGYAFGDVPLNQVLRRAWNSPFADQHAQWLVVIKPGTAGELNPRVSHVLNADGVRLPAISEAGLPDVVADVVDFWKADQAEPEPPEGEY